MNTRITWIALTSAVLGAVCVTAVACSPDSATSAASSVESPALSRSAKSPEEQYAWMGRYHNDALAFATQRIKSSGKLTKYDQCRTGLDALAEFQKAYRKAGGPAVFDDLTITAGMCEAATGKKTGFAAARAISTAGIAPVSDISLTASGYMDQILTEVDYASSVPGLAFAVSQIENQAFGSLNALEAGAVAGTGSIAVSSADYWTTAGGTLSDGGEVLYARSGNSTGPAPVVINPRLGPVYSISPLARRIIKADIMAAISVLIYDWWMGEAALGKAAIKAAAASLVAGIFTT